MPTNALPILPPPLQQRLVDARVLLTVPWALFFRWILGALAMPTYAEGTHIERIGDPASTDPALNKGMPASTFKAGAFYWETDRTVLYQAAWDPDGDPAWVYVSGTMRNVLANKPADLGDNDKGFLFYSTDYAHTWRWGVITSYTDLVIGGTNTQLTSAAHPFSAAHVGKVINITGGAGFTDGRYVVLSVAGSTATLDGPLGTAGSTAGTGTFTDWEYAPGDRVSGEIAWFTAGPGTGWALCDGAAVTRTTATAGTAAFTTPNLIGAYPKGGSTYSGTVVPASGSASGTTDAESGHVHSVTTNAVTSGIGDIDSPVYAISSGSGINTRNEWHKHNVPGQTVTSAGGSAHSHTISGLTLSGVEPAHVDLLPYYRL